MGVTEALSRWALSRPTVLIVDSPGTDRLRWAIDAELDRRGWRRAVTPADSDVVLVLGTPGPRLAAAIDVLWKQVPRPRTRTEIRSAGGVADGLASAVERLHDRGSERGEMPAPERESPIGQESTEDGTAGQGTSVELGSGDHDGGVAHGSADHAGHTHHGGHMHHGGMVDGLPMAETVPDRDGLELDSLRVTLGPILPAWPTGLTVTARMQGDVLTDVAAAWIDDEPAGPARPADDVPPQIWALDSLSRFCDVAGWPTMSRRARHARNALLAPADSPVRKHAAAEATAIAEAMSRSRLLRWSMRGSSPGDDDIGRICDWCDLAAGATQDGRALRPIDLGDLVDVVTGQELATLRLRIAGLVPAGSAPRPAVDHHA